MTSISALTGLSVSRLRELMKYSSEDSAGVVESAVRPDAAVVALPNRPTPEPVDTAPREAAVGAQ
jgi:hypothetical protein